ncbi:MAG: hypothetical protein QM696_11840 [Steroidobacteraceae bacterium]
MERFLMLWDELDEYFGYGWHLAAALGHAVSTRGGALKRLLTP